MPAQTSILDMIISASFIVQLVMLLLLTASVSSWAIIVRKRRVLRQAVASSNAFETSFWSGGDLAAIYRDVTRGGEPPSDMAGLFEAGFREFRRLTEQPGMAPAQILEGVRRTMHVAQMREMDRLEESLATLATIGSTSPYVGLFGTVWGIMNSFRGLGNVQSATLAVVAPGIAEALVATAIGHGEKGSLQVAMMVGALLAGIRTWIASGGTRGGEGVIVGSMRAMATALATAQARA